MPITISEEAGIRYLQFGAHWIQGAMRVKRPWTLELEYARDMMFPLLLRPRSWPRKVLTIGLGAAALTKFLYRHCPRSTIDVVEIEPEVVLSAYQFFALPDDPGRLSIHIDDGYKFVANAHERYDFILLDGFDAKVEAGNLDSPRFYRNCRALLKPGGIVAVNLVSRRGRPTASIDRLRKVFDDRVLVLPRNDANTVVLASRDKPPFIPYDKLLGSARELKARSGLDLQATLSTLHERR
ncbi:MAG TPA: spermidine synthase [Burkholderiales bacterium]|nr:spermidine synthase [Burkholderiales bacterium]